MTTGLIIVIQVGRMIAKFNPRRMTFFSVDETPNLLLVSFQQTTVDRRK